MSKNVPPPMLNLVPESAPFSEAQREWLNGFLAGFLSLESVTPLLSEQAAALIGDAAVADDDDIDTPWHDQTLPMTERMTLADGKPLRWRMMAAMAQQDCGQCGYDCKNYSDAIFSRKEERLNLCVPGGKETARMLKELHAELGNAAAKAAVAPAVAQSAAPAQSTFGYSRNNPATATLISRRLLNKPGSRKGNLARRVRSFVQRPRLYGRRRLWIISHQRSDAGRCRAQGA